MLITAASVDGGGSGGSVYESDGGWERYGPRIGHLDHEPVVGGSGVDLGYKEEELECRNLEVEAEVRKLEETLEYQRMIENQAKQKHLAESIYWQVPLSQRQGNGFCNGAGHVPGETGDEASQKISVTHSNCLSIGVGDNGSEGFNRRTGRRGKREKYPNELYIDVLQDIGFSLEHTNSSGDKTLMFPYRRYQCDQGNFSTCLVGTYKLVWDNSYSTFFKKVLRYKVDCIPPVVEPLTSGREPLQVADGIVIDILMHGHLVSSSVTDYTMDGGEVQEPLKSKVFNTATPKLVTLSEACIVRGNASVDSRRQSCVINPERDSHVRVESKVQELCFDKLSLKIETQGLQHRDTDYREFSQSHTPTKAASTSKDTIAPRDRSEFRLESQLHVVETDSSEVKNDLLSSDIQSFRYF
ncbi:hypothetical protein POM88_027741 [Heracleum sosnowskyi]|uniref:Uncharacterized protein n=1 Tax=Heracleum sosnowskyi TaxID=360622 RepID=A0AAD8IAK4_9APIA|nr:hypothetical protein POM88_027741 [Heracleum sosnowskyi]